MIRVFIGINATMLLLSCASRTISLNTMPVAEVSLIDLNHPQLGHERLGQTPLAIDASRVRGKFLRLNQGDHAPLYFAFLEEPVGSVDLNFKINHLPSLTTKQVCENVANAQTFDGAFVGGDKDRELTLAINGLMRDLLGVIEAYKSEDFEKLRIASESLAKHYPDLSAPYIFIGLAHLHEGKIPLARENFERASQLDPRNEAVKTLLNNLD